MYSDANDFSGAQVFTGLTFTYGAGGALALTYRGGSSNLTTGLTQTSFSSGTVYTIEIVGNNKTSGTINYNYAGVARSVAVQKFDLYINGSLIGDDLAEALLPANTAIDSGTFIGISSTSNVANVFVDDAVVYNAVPADIPPSIGTYSPTSVGLSGNVVTTNPSAAPANATSLTASTTSNFKGTFTVNNATGAVRVTNAYPAGSYTVTVRAFGPGGTATQTFSLTVTTPTACSGTVSFVTAPDVSGPDAIQNVTTGDFNNDGKQDIVFARLVNNAIAIRLGDGAGNFSGTGGTGVGQSPYGITVGDFNGDGKLDAATSNEGPPPFNNPTISWALGDGAGGLAAATTITAGFVNNGPKDIRAADMNNDGKLDLVFVTGAVPPSGGNSQIGVAIGDGAGGFAAPTYTSTTISNGNAYGMAVGDVNNDGNVDVAVAHYIGSTLSVSLGNGTGGFTSTATYGSGSVATFVALGDVNNANGPDLIGTFGSGVTAPFANNGAGTFSALATLATPGAQSVVIGDFNRDGKADLAVAEAGAVKQTSIWLGSGTGTFAASTVTSTGSSPVGSTLGDVNGDGYQDVLTANGNGSTGLVTVRLGACNPKITTTGTVANFGNVVVGATSSEQTYTVSGAALTNDITVTAPSTDFQVSKTTGSGFASSITFTQSGGTVPTSTVFVRFTPQSAGAKSGNITNASSGATTQNVAVSGTGVGETDVAISGGNLVITDTNGGTTNDTLTISLVGANVRINDPNHPLTAGAGATQIDVNTVEVPFASISGNIQVNTLGGNDLLTLNFGGGNLLPAGGLSYAGGSQTASPGDRLAIVGGTQGTVTYNYSSPNDGNVVMSAYGTVTYTGLEPISNSGNATDVVFNLPAGPNAITLADDGVGGNGMSRLSGATIEQTDFANPSGSVTVAAGNAADTIAVNALPDLTSTLSLTAGAASFDTITFSGAVTLAAGKNLNATSSSLITVNGNLTTSGAGATALTAADVSGSGNLTTGVGGLTVTNTGTSTLSGVVAGANATLTKQGTGTLILSAANTYTGATLVNQGVLRVNGSTAAASFVTVNSGGTLGGSGTVGGPVNVNSGGSIAPGASPGILNTGNVGFGSGSTFAVEIDGATVGTGYDQLNVTGTVALGNATLALSGTHTPIAGQQFVIVNNDLADGVTGTFNGLAEGATITNFLGSGLNATISYAGGSNTNDVVLTVVSPCTPPSTVYVDDSWVGTPIGTDPDSGGPATNFGCDSFATIQDGINGVTAGGTVIVRPGTYAEAILINKSLSLQGAQFGQNPNTRFAAFVTGPNGPKANPAIESIITAAATAPASAANDPVHVAASNVSIDGFVVDGNNPALNQTGAPVIGGVNIDARRAIQTEDAAGTAFPANSVTVQYNVMQNFSQRGVELINGTASNTAPDTTGNVITQNLVRNFGLDGIVLAFNAYADVTFNTVLTNDFPTEAGIWVQDFLNSGTPHTTNINNNNVTVGQDNFGGIWVNLAYLGTLNINNNTVNAAGSVTSGFDFTYGIYLSSLRPGTTASLNGNIVGSSGGEFDRGIALWNVGTSPTTTTVTGGTVGKSAKAVTLHDNDPNFGLAGSNAAANISGVSIDGTGVGSSVGIFVDASGSTGDTVAMDISGNTSVSNTTTAISVAGANASANVHDNIASIHNNTTAFSVSGGSATITRNQIYSNTTSLQFGSSGTATAHFNRIISTTTAIANPSNLTPNLENNWWGCNAGPGNAGCGAVTGTGADFDPWIVLKGSASPNSITPGGSSLVTADMTQNSNNVVPVGGPIPNVAVSYSATNGTMTPTSGTITNGTDSSTFNSTNSSNAVATITVDGQPVNVPITVTAPSFSINDVTMAEGNGGPGTTSFIFTITKTGATALNSSVDYATLDSSATSPSDFTALPTTNVVFLPSDTTKQVTVFVNGDTTFEPNEQFSVQLSNPSGATISDPSGVGTITNDDACAAFATVYVDDSWVGTTPGTDPDGVGPATSFGCDSFATIQGGVNGVTAGGTVNVAAGNYVENVTIPKALTLTGAGAGSVFVYPAISNPNCGGGGGGSLCAGGSNIMLVQADNVTISGLTLDGDNTSLAGGFNVGGANVDARNGIITNHLLATYNNLEVHHLTVRNIYLRGVYASSGGSFNFHDNTVQNVQAEAASIGMFNFGGAGTFTNNNVSLCNDAISSNHSRGTTYTGNTVTTSASGIHTDNAGDGGGTNDTISGNTVTNGGYGIWVFVPYKTVNVQNNTVTNMDVGYAVFGDSGVTTSTRPTIAPAETPVQNGRPAPASVNVLEPEWVRLKPANTWQRIPNAPPAPPYAASFTGNTVDGQNKANSTGVYFSTNQLGFGSGNPKVKFFSNTVVNNVDGFFLEAETGFTLETAASFNRIVNNTNSQVTQNTGVGFAGTLNGSMENNWWGCNAGPGNLGCGVVVGAGVDFNPWIVLGISASPSTIPPGGSSTITADMTHNSAAAVPSVTDFVPQVAVTFGATNGTVFPTSGTITNGQATTTFTSNSTSSGSASATVDNQTVSTPINVSAANTYTWSPTLGTDWTLPANWTPLRVLPQANDTLVINGTTTPAPTLTNIPTQTIAGLHLINGPLAILQAGGTNTLTINGASGSDLTVPASSSLTLSGANPLTIKVTGAGSAGTFGGVFVELSGAHKLLGDSGAVITFQNGSLATTGTGLTTNPFGTGGAGDGNAGSVIFNNGSTYSHNGGLSPFGTAGNPSVAVFQTGSLARWFTNGGFQASGRSYADLQIGDGTTAVNVSDSGAGDFQFDNLTIMSTGSTNSSLVYTGSGTALITIRGNVSSTGIGSGSLSDLTLTPGSQGTHINKIGGGTLTFSTTGNTRSIDLENGATIDNTPNPTTLALSRVVITGISNPHSNEIFVDTGSSITGGSSGYVVGGINMQSVPNGSFAYPVGTVGAYTPANLTNASGGGNLRVAVRTPQQPVLAPATSLQRYWSLTRETGSLTTDLTFHYLDGDVAGNENNYKLVIVESGNATSFPNDANNNVNPAANTFSKLAVQNFSDWTAAEPAAPTAVKLTGFTATRYENGEVQLNWQSGYEVSNLGYNIYREENGRRVALTPSLIAGSALLAGAQTQLTAGLSYSWTDDGGQRSAVSGQKSGANYWLEDVDLNGTRTLHGPIAASDCRSLASGCKERGQSSRLLRDLADPQSAISNRQSWVQFSGWPAGQRTANIPTDADDLARQQALEQRPGVKLSVSREGWYRVTQPELMAAGMDAHMDATHLQLYVNGRAIPLKQSGDGVHLTGDDYIEFYGQGLDSTTDAARTYFLTLADGVGTRIRAPFAQALNPPSGATSFAYTIERKERMIYFASLLNGDAENFFGQIVSSGDTNSSLPVSRLDSEQTAQLEISLQGVTSEGHHVRVLLNGNDLGSVNFDNATHASEIFTVSGADLVEGENTVTLKATGGEEDISLVDVLRLTYSHQYVADNNYLALLVSDQQTKQFSGFDNANIRVIDVTSPETVKELTPAAEVTPQADGSYAVALQVPGATPLKQHKLLVFAESSPQPVDAVRENRPSSWAAETAGADYLLITTGDLQGSVEPLRQLRAAQGLVVKVVDVEDLYDEFTFGEHSPQAIRDFLAKATTDWTRKPHYVMFAGDASYDPKNYLGQGMNDLVPTKLIDTTLTEAASDDWLADFNNDGIADLALGRLPVRTAADLDLVVGKLLAYEAATPDPARGALLVSDTGFEAANTTVHTLLPSGLPVVTINRSAADDATVHNQIISGLNQGPLVTNYIGHGSNGVWTGASLLSLDDAPTLTNNSRLSVFTMMTCYNGYFQNAFNDSLAEALLKSQGGAVAVWASTTLTDPSGQNAIDQEFYRLLFGAQPATLGDAARSAKFVTTDQSVRRTWTLFGDPAMRLR
ncbi:MAG TPA: C25 family cysteine peptidase [Pyrinomonadaceae bacterium]|nr:C25 family cysteine peptidase [Pyrinomonadaceae bacterium]